MQCCKKEPEADITIKLIVSGSLIPEQVSEK